MKGIVAAGGLATRLLPMTEIINKHLLPVYNLPMIYYPIQTLIKAGITDIAIVVSGNFAGQFIHLLKNGEAFGLKKLTYLFQSNSSGGISDAVRYAEEFAEGEPVTIILGDNVTDADISKGIREFKNGASVFLKKVPDPERFGCPRFEDNKIVEIIEKPKVPPSDYAVTGIYITDNKIFDYIRKCKPSARNQLEISDVLNFYIEEDKLQYSYLDGFWIDSGVPDSLFEAGEYWYKKSKETK